MRFSLRALLALVLCVAVLCALLFSVPNRLALIILLVITLHAPVAAVLGVVYFDGSVRAFSIGAAAGLANTFLMNMLYSNSMVLEEVAALIQGVTSTDGLDDYVLGKVIFVHVLGGFFSGGVLGVLAWQLSIRRKLRAASVELPRDSDSQGG